MAEVTEQAKMPGPFASSSASASVAFTQAPTRYNSYQKQRQRNASPSNAITAVEIMSLQDSSAPNDYGDFVDSDDEFEIEESAEPLERYHQPGLYYPICIGEVLAQTYRIEHKLGHGKQEGCGSQDHGFRRRGRI
ncbi:hypothetical protein PRK78_007259 [Emydomyces testavorans]|uniref:Uncharacterized protein n=1 Tax=Emydomyces testavorans TaxID=2070801 RepID=A0AAF0ILA1_9EURO|nr:hypothetical protein PRK78_007259 [Emydomyces testavorans]